MSIELKGKKVADEITKACEKRATIFHENNIVPTLGIIRVGQREDDLFYEKMACKKLGTIGIKVTLFEYPLDIKQEYFESDFEQINNSPNIHGILLFRPLPKTLDENKIRNLINPIKDVDCMSSHNLAKIFEGDTSLFPAPCTSVAVMEMLNSYDIDVAGKNVVIIGRSLVVAKPLSMLLLNKNATITICHSKTKNIENICKNADILITAAGVAKMINKEYVNKDMTVIDVGINVGTDGKMCGDVDYDEVSPLVHSITPVPKGIGSITTSILAKQLLDATEILHKA